MTTLQAFNEMMGQFLDELHEVFPDDTAITTAQAAPRDRGTLDTFMKSTSKWSTQMMQKDESFFCEENEFVKNLNLHVIWKTEACTLNTKNAIWQYLHSMYMIGTTMSMFPPETLAMIEAAAENATKNMKNSSGQIDEAALMSSMNNMLSQMLGGGGGGANPLAALLGGAAQQQPQPRRRPQTNQKNKKKTSQ